MLVYSNYSSIWKAEEGALPQIHANLVYLNSMAGPANLVYLNSMTGLQSKILPPQTTKIPLIIILI